MNINININTGIKDKDGKDYKVGDIVLNTYFGDYWIVRMYNGSKIEQYKKECPYYLALYGDEDDCFIDLDEPGGFKIICTNDEPEYKDLLKMFKKVRRDRKWFEFKLDIKYKIYKPIESIGKLGHWLLRRDKNCQTGNIQSKTVKKK